MDSISRKVSSVRDMEKESVYISEDMMVDGKARKLRKRKSILYQTIEYAWADVERGRKPAK